MNIVRDPNVRHGFPCFEGTRIPYDAVLQFCADFEDFKHHFPQLDESALEAAISFDLHDATMIEKLKFDPDSPLIPVGGAIT